MSFLAIAAASAATVAVLDLDGYGTTWASMGDATQGLRDAFLEDGRLDPVSGSDIADGVSKGQDSGLRRAREQYAQARRAFDGGDVATAIPALTEAIRLHDNALSDVGRRAELADAHSLLGQCLTKSGRALEAKAAFTKAALLNPDFATGRSALSGVAGELAQSAAESLRQSPRRVRPAEQVEAIRDSLGVDYVVSGWIEGDGRIVAKLHGEGGYLGEGRAALAAMPAPSVDDAYGAIARDLADTAGGGGPVAAQEDRPEEAEPVEEIEPAEEEVAPRPTTSAARVDESDQPVAKRSSTRVSGMRYEAGPITDQWWFWAGVAAVVAGGGVAVVAAVSQPEPTVEHAPDEWSVTVGIED